MFECLHRRADITPTRGRAQREGWGESTEFRPVGASLTHVATPSDDPTLDPREGDVADMAKRAALAASERRRRLRESGEITVEDIDETMLAELDRLLEDVSAWTPGFAGAMLFRGAAAQPLVSLITSGEREAMRRALIHVASSVRIELDMIERDVLGQFVDSVTSTSRGAVIVIRMDDDLLVVAIEGRPAKVADAWKAIANRKADLAEVAAKLVREDP